MTQARTVAIIPNFNGKQFLGPCIDALLAQKPIAPDVVVVDNASADGSSDFVRTNYPSVKVIDMDHNTGFGIAVNQGIRDTAHELIALVNNDATVQPGWLAALEKSLDEEPAAAAVAPKVLFHTDENILDSTGDMCTAYGFAYKRGHFEEDTGQYNTADEIFSVSAVATLFRRGMFDRIGLFDENFFAYYEDLDLCYRARLAGFRFFYEPGALVLHRYSATSDSKMKLGSEEVYIHLTGIWLKTVPGAIILKHLPSVVLFHSVIVFSVLVARIRKKNRLPRVALLRFVASMLRERGRVQALRAVSVNEIEKMLVRDSVFGAFGSRLKKMFKGK